MTDPHIVRDADAERLAWIGGSVHHIVLDGATTGNRYTAVRSSMSGSAASPVHVHEHDDEIVFLLSGSGVFWAGGDKWALSSGDTAFLPRGVPHTYLFTSDTAEIIAVTAPAGMEHFFRAAGWDLSSPKPDDWTIDLDTLAAAAKATGQIILGPPLGPDDLMPPELLAR